MTTEDYWKERYNKKWEQASEREKKIAKLIEKRTGSEVVLTGLGAGSAEFLSGDASSYGHEKGDPDLHIVGTNIYIEVSGPTEEKVGRNDDLWIRPDKVENARKHHSERDTWFLHCLAKDNTMRVIHLNAQFFELVDRGVFKTIHPKIRGTQETYLAIPANHPCVLDWDAQPE